VLDPQVPGKRGPAGVYPGVESEDGPDGERGYGVAI
jgi:hypothetical protein